MWQFQSSLKLNSDHLGFSQFESAFISQTVEKTLIRLIFD
jgi:hypothetical protein